MQFHASPGHTRSCGGGARVSDALGSTANQTHRNTKCCLCAKHCRVNALCFLHSSAHCPGLKRWLRHVCAICCLGLTDVRLWGSIPTPFSLTKPSLRPFVCSGNLDSRAHSFPVRKFLARTGKVEKASSAMAACSSIRLFARCRRSSRTLFSRPS